MCNDVAEHIQVLLLANQEYTFCLTSISHTGPRVSEGSEILNTSYLFSKLLKVCIKLPNVPSGSCLAATKDMNGFLNNKIAVV